jgi:uncharacterized membrane protein
MRSPDQWHSPPRGETPPEEQEPTPARVEAFSDGVFAIAITLLVLGLRIPTPVDGSAPPSLLTALLQNWPGFLAYLISWIVILEFWINHYGMFHLLARIDHLGLIINGVLLLGVTLVPFSTIIMAEYIGLPDQNVAAFVYSGTFLLSATGYAAFWEHAAYRGRLLKRSVDPVRVQWLTYDHRISWLAIFIALVLAPIRGAVTVAIFVPLVTYWLLPLHLRHQIVDDLLRLTRRV